jgi:hypothetical protein
LRIEIMTTRDAPGAQFEIRVNGVARTYRDRRDPAIDAARFLEQRNPGATVVVTDLRDGSVVQHERPVK